jgi:signal transduction histidine kinase
MKASRSKDGMSDATGLLGLRDMADALDRWHSHPGEASHAELSRTFARVIENAGLTGGHLRLDAPPLAEVDLRTGALADRGAAGGGGGDGEGDVRSYRLSFGDRALAALELDAPPAAMFSVDEFAHGLDIVIGSAWSRARASQSKDELAALDAATRGIAGVLDLERVLQLITDRVRELAHAQYAALGIVDQEGSMERFITSGLTREERERIGPPPRGHGLLGVIVHETSPVRIHDVVTDPRRYGFPAHHPEMHSLLGVPIGTKGRSIGRLYLTNKLPAGDFTEDDERMVETFALHAAIAIENARLHEQVQRMAIVEERERIGRDLHDGIIQSIYAVGLSLEDVPELMEDEPEVARHRIERAIDSLDQSIRDIRNFIFGLRPELLEQAGLVGGLGALADEFRVNSMVDVELEASGVDESRLPRELITQLLSIGREALSNIARHSKASRATIEVSIDGSSIRLVISDNGVGFDPRLQRGPAHQGLVNMRDRSASIGGDLVIESKPDAGTRIILSVPYMASARVREGDA